MSNLEAVMQNSHRSSLGSGTGDEEDELPEMPEQHNEDNDGLDGDHSFGLGSSPLSKRTITRPPSSVGSRGKRLSMLPVPRGTRSSSLASVSKSSH